LLYAEGFSQSFVKNMYVFFVLMTEDL